jgi:ABC-2 type transport system permease protein
VHDLLGSVRSEWLKARKRPAVWVLLAVLAGVVVALGYVLPWAVLSHPPPGTRFGPGTSPGQLKQLLYPAHFAGNALGGGGLAGPIALILGVLMVGSEYGWGTFKTILTQRPGRLHNLAARITVLYAILAIYVIAVFTAAAASSAVLALADGAALRWPEASEVARAALAALLIDGWWGLLGMAMAFLFRQSALAIGLGLAYSFIVEGLIFNVLGALGNTVVRSVERFFPGQNAQALAASFGTGSGATSPAIGATEATVVLCLYCLAAVTVSALLLRLRDVT